MDCFRGNWLIPAAETVCEVLAEILCLETQTVVSGKPSAELFEQPSHILKCPTFEGMVSALVSPSHFERNKCVRAFVCTIRPPELF